MKFYDIIFTQQYSHIPPVIFTIKAENMDEAWEKAQESKMLYWFIHEGDPGVPSKKELSDLFNSKDEQFLAGLVKDWVEANVEVKVELFDD